LIEGPGYVVRVKPTKAIGGATLQPALTEQDVLAAWMASKGP